MRAGLDSDEERVEVSVVPLPAGQNVDHAVDLTLELRIRMRSQAVSGGLDPLGGVRVPEDMRHGLLVGGPLHRVQPTGTLAVVVLDRQGYFAIDRQPRRPERIVNLDVRQRHGRKPAE